MSNPRCHFCGEFMAADDIVQMPKYGHMGLDEVQLAHKKCKEDFDQFCDVMSAHDEQIFKDHQEYDRVNNRILKAIESVKGALFTESLMNLIKESEGILGKARITRHPEGHKWQKEWYSRQIQGIWITQVTGYLGDDFSGTISVKIRKGRYFTFDYAC